MKTFERFGSLEKVPHKWTIFVWPSCVLLVAAFSVSTAYHGLYPPKRSLLTVIACIAPAVTLLTILLQKRHLRSASWLTALIFLFCLLLLCGG